MNLFLNKMKEKEIMERIYDTLMKNTNNPQFKQEDLEHQSLDCDKDKIYFVLDEVEYCLSINKTDNAYI